MGELCSSSSDILALEVDYFTHYTLTQDVQLKYAIQPYLLTNTAKQYNN